MGKNLVMLTLLFDENIDRDIVRGLELRLPNLDFTTVQEVGLAGAADPDILEWAASTERILVTHDLRTMPKYAAQRIRAGLPISGMFAVAKTLPVGQVIEELILLVECSFEREWENQVVYLPL